MFWLLKFIENCVCIIKNFCLSKFTFCMEYSLLISSQMYKIIKFCIAYIFVKYYFNSTGAIVCNKCLLMLLWRTSINIWRHTKIYKTWLFMFIIINETDLFIFIGFYIEDITYNRPSNKISIIIFDFLLNLVEHKFSFDYNFCKECIITISTWPLLLTRYVTQF